MVKMRVLLITLITFTSSLALPKPTHACTPPPPPPEGTEILPYTLEDKISASDVIFEGTVVDVQDEFVETATIKVHRYFKGTGPSEVLVGNFGPASICLSTISVGAEGIFFTTEDANKTLQAQYLPYNYAKNNQFMGPITSTQPETIADLITIVGEEPFTPPTPTLTSNMGFMGRVFVISLVAIGGIAIFLWRNKGNS